MEASSGELLEILEEIRKEIRAIETKLDSRLALLEKELYGYRMLMRVFKVAGGIVLAVATLKFGDIKNLF